MTFWAQAIPGNTKRVDVKVTYGPIAITVAEDVGHLRSFMGQLENLLETVESGETVESAK